MKSFFKYFDDLLIWAGCALIVFGTWQVCQQATPFAAGIMLIGLGVLYGMGKPGKRGGNDHQQPG